MKSICFVSKIHEIAADVITVSSGKNRQNAALEDGENPCLLISVGAKRVLTCWKQKNGITKFKEEAANTGPDNETGSDVKPSSGKFLSVSFQWLSTDMPIKHCSTRERSHNTEKDVTAAESVADSDVEAAENDVGSDAVCLSPFPENRKIESESCLGDEFENDWRYLAVTAFLVKVAYSR